MRIIERYFFDLSSPIKVYRILVIGIIELRGVLNSWATDEKNIDLTLYDVDSNSFIFVISLINAITYYPLLISDAFT